MKYLSKLMSMLLMGAMLWTVGCADYDEEIRDLNNKVDDIHQSLIENQIDPLKADLEATKKALNDAIAAAKSEIMAAHKADVDALKAADQKLTNDLATARQEATDAITKLGTDMSAALSSAVKALEAADDAIENDIKDLETVDTEIKADLAELSKKVSDNYDALKALIDKNTTDIAAVKTALENHVKAFEAYKTEVAGTLAAHEARLKALEDATAALEKRVDGIDALLVEHKNLIDTNAANIDKLSKHVDDVYAELTQADKDLKTLIENTAAAIRGELKVVEDKFDAEFVKAYGEIAKNTSAINALRAEYEAHATAATARFEAIEKVQGEHASKIKTIEENLTKLDEKVDSELAKVRKELQEAADKALADAKAYADQGDAAVTEAYKKAIADEAKAIREELAQAVKDLEAKLDALKTELTNLINQNFEALKGRIQSIVFVPEYNDGKGTINYAYAGNTLVETRSTLVYQVYPADCASIIANNFIAGEDAILYYVHEDLKANETRSDDHKFNIVSVKGELDGRLQVTIEPRNLEADFYAGEKEYAVSLVLDTEIANLSTVFTNVVPTNHPERIAMDMMYGEEVIAGCYNVPGTGAFEYTNTEKVEKVLPEHYVMFTVGEKKFKGIEELNAAGYALTMERTNYIRRDYNEHLGTRPFKVEEVEKVLEVTVAEVNGQLIYQPIYVGYTYTAGGLKAEAYSIYTTVPVQATISMNAVTASWLYSKDAIVDAANTGAYTRVLDMTVAEHNLPTDVTVAQALADAAISTKVTLDGEEVAVNAKFVLDSENNVHLEFSNFAWDKTYEVEAKYGVADSYGQVFVEATFKAVVNTVDRNREPIVINLDPSTEPFALNMQLTNKISDNLDVVYETLVFGNEQHYDITSDEWLSGNFVVNYTYTNALVADGNEVVVNDSFNTMLAIDEVNNDGKSVFTAFSYADFDFVPAQLEYTKTITTWYGQVVVLNKTLNFDFPVYDFKHNSKYVYGADNDYYSQVQPEYTWMDDDESKGLLAFDVAAVDLRAAFSIVDGEGNKLTDEQMAALSMTSNFKIEDPENIHGNITINSNDELSYYGSNPFVDVRGNIVITHDNGAKYVVPTSFDKGGKYETYNVVKFNPIGTAEVTSHPTIDVNNAIIYTVDILKHVSLKDHRSNGRPSFDLISNGAWVVGNGSNGFAQGVEVTKENIYRISETWTNDLSEVDEEIRPYITSDNGKLTFDNTQQLELTGPFTVPVTLKFNNCWMEKPQQVTVKVTFNPINDPAKGNE